MPEVTFLEEDNTPNQKRRPVITTASKSKIAGFLIKKGLAKNETQANIYLIIIAIVCIGLTIYLNVGNEVVLPPQPL